MKRERRSFDKEFKLMSVNLCYTGKTSGQVGEELGIRAELVRRWMREHENKGGRSFPGKGKIDLSADQAEIVRLQRALKEAQIERDILKKAVNIFSRSDGKFFNS